jgi:DNA-binding MarR family transcriptional regulator
VGVRCELREERIARAHVVSLPFALEYLDVERLHSWYLDVKRFDVKTVTVENDTVDDLLARLDDANAPLDLEVEGIVDRIASINKRVRSALKETLAVYGITPEDWGLLTTLRLRKENAPVSPGALARWHELSSGAMTSRLDRLESSGFVRRVPDPQDRRGVVIELTDAGRQAWEKAIEVQGRKEAFFASALTKDEQRQLNDLLRKLMVALVARERAGRPSPAAAEEE